MRWGHSWFVVGVMLVFPLRRSQIVQVKIDRFVTFHEITITDNNFAQVRFSEPSSRVAEGTPRHTADVQLLLADGDQLARAISVDVVDLLTGTGNPTNDYANAIPMQGN